MRYFFFNIWGKTKTITLPHSLIPVTIATSRPAVVVIYSLGINGMTGEARGDLKAFAANLLARWLGHGEFFLRPLGHRR